MPVKKTKMKYWVLALALLMLDLFLASTHSKPQQPHRLPSGKSSAGWKGAAKADGALSVSIEVPNQSPSGNIADNLILKARVIPQYPIGQAISFRWIVPAGVLVLQGSVADSWQNVQMNQPIETEIILSGYSAKTSGRIHFHAEYEIDGHKIGNTAVYSAAQQVTKYFHTTALSAPPRDIQF